MNRGFVKPILLPYKIQLVIIFADIFEWIIFVTKDFSPPRSNYFFRFSPFHSGKRQQVLRKRTTCNQHKWLLVGLRHAIYYNASRIFVGGSPSLSFFLSAFLRLNFYWYYPNCFVNVCNASDYVRTWSGNWPNDPKVRIPAKQRKRFNFTYIWKWSLTALKKLDHFFIK